MTEDRWCVAADFDARSADDSKNQWHRACAEGLIAHSAIRGRDRVLDAGAGNGFAAICRRYTGLSEWPRCGVDVSPGMLQQAQVAVDIAGLQNIELLQADACDLRDQSAVAFGSSARRQHRARPSLVEHSRRPSILALSYAPRRIVRDMPVRIGLTLAINVCDGSRAMEDK